MKSIPHVISERLEQLAQARLGRGSHPSFEDGACAIEWASYLSGEPFSDKPECVSPVIAAFLRSWNDALPDADRDRLLKPLIPRLIGTRASDEVERQRSYLALDWLVRECAPAFCDLVPALQEIVATVRALDAITDTATAATAAPIVQKMCDQSIAARAAAGAAARDAAWVAARAAAGVAARAAARDAAGDAAWVAAWVAAGANLAPTVAHLQQSALSLVERMLAVKP